MLVAEAEIADVPFVAASRSAGGDRLDLSINF